MPCRHLAACLVGGLLLALLVSASLGGRAGAGQEEFEFSGEVSAVTDSTLTVASACWTAEVAVTADTEVVDAEGNPADRAQITVGVWVTVTARETEVGLEAVRVQLYGRPDVVTVTPEETVEATPDSTTVPRPEGTGADPEEFVGLEGVITSIGSDRLEVETDFAAVTVVVDEATIITLADGGEGSLDDLLPGQRVAVKGRRGEGDVVIALVIAVASEESETAICSIESTGVVLRMSEAELVISSAGYVTAFRLTAATVIERSEEQPPDVRETAAVAGEPLTVADLAPGFLVRVEANETVRGYEAGRVGVLDEEDRGFTLIGALAAVATEAVEVETGAGVFRIGLAPETLIRHADGSEATVADLDVGTEVSVVTGRSVDPVAVEIVVLDIVPVYETFRATTVEGVVRHTGPAGRGLRLRAGDGPDTIRVDANTWLEHADGREAALADAASGIFVEASGTAEGRRELLASEIRLADRRHDAGGVRAIVLNESGSGWLVLKPQNGPPRLVRLDGRTRVVRIDGSPASPADLRAGSALLVQGVGARGRWIADRLILAERAGQLLRFEGSVTELAGGRITVRGGGDVVSAVFTPATLVLDHTGRAVRRSSLDAGRRILLIGYRDGSDWVLTLARRLPRRAE